MTYLSKVIGGGLNLLLRVVIIWTFFSKFALGYNYKWNGSNWKDTRTGKCESFFIIVCVR